jgi:cyclophilin family peptidyl-prolyl cis-trans isomerase
MSFRFRSIHTVFAAIFAAACLLGSGSAAEPDQVKAVLELRGSFLYAGQPLLVRLSLGNEGADPIKNPFQKELLKGFVVTKEDGTELKATGKPRADEPTRPEKLNPMSFYGTVVDLAEMYPDLANPGRYTLFWQDNAVKSLVYNITIINEYDPSKVYQGIIETGAGTIVMDFFPAEAPIAVKAFIDMANSGFYSGLAINEVHANEFIVAGDPAVGDNGGRKPVTFPAEMTKIPMVAGTVILKPVMASPPGNSSVFMVLLGPKPKLSGQATAFGQVVRGMDVVRKISERPARNGSGKARFRPIKDIPILSVEIRERTKAR